MNLRKKLLGINDPRSFQGIYSRGANVYNGGSSSAHSGGGLQFGRPRKTHIRSTDSRQAAIKRRLTPESKLKFNPKVKLDTSQVEDRRSKMKKKPAPAAIKRRMVKR